MFSSPIKKAVMAEVNRRIEDAEKKHADKHVEVTVRTEESIKVIREQAEKEIEQHVLAMVKSILG